MNGSASAIPLHRKRGRTFLKSFDMYDLQLDVLLKKYLFILICYGVTPIGHSCRIAVFNVQNFQKKFSGESDSDS